MACRTVWQALAAGLQPNVLTEEEIDALEMHFVGHLTKDGLF